jgi:hypothetical protein
VMTPEEAADAVTALGAEREAENREADAMQAAMDSAAVAAVPDEETIARWMA